MASFSKILRVAPGKTLEATITRAARLARGSCTRAGRVILPRPFVQFWRRLQQPLWPLRHAQIMPGTLLAQWGPWVFLAWLSYRLLAVSWGEHIGDLGAL